MSIPYRYRPIAAKLITMQTKCTSRSPKLFFFVFHGVFYECETLSLTLKEEHRLRMLENRVLRRIFGPKRDNVTGGWRNLHNEELHGLYSSPCIVTVIKARRMRWAGTVARMEEVRGA
jgi:hypothetical protein